MLFARSKHHRKALWILWVPFQFEDVDVDVASPLTSTLKHLKTSEALTISAGQFGFSLVVIFSALVLMGCVACVWEGFASSQFCWRISEFWWSTAMQTQQKSTPKRKPLEWDKLNYAPDPSHLLDKVWLS